MCFFKNATILFILTVGLGPNRISFVPNLLFLTSARLIISRFWIVGERRLYREMIHSLRLCGKILAEI